MQTVNQGGCLIIKQLIFKSYVASFNVFSSFTSNRRLSDLFKKNESVTSDTDGQTEYKKQG